MPPKRNTSGNKRTAKVKKTAAGYKFPERIPSGFIVRDTRKEEWCIHESIGTGGFGEIYSASKVNEKSKINSTHPYAIKVEPKENGPLYVEMHFYMRVGKTDDIESWKKSRKLKSLGMPALYGSGTFEFKSSNYRFLVTEKFGRNLQNIFNECGKKFPLVTVLQIGVQVLNVLEYIHEKGFIHGDIKAANLMLGSRPGSENTVYVIDFGLAAKCQVSDKEFNKDPKKAHNGTIEYISRDGHSGVFGFRGDLEILGYNLIHWLTGSLPWEKDIENQSVVEQKKIELMNEPNKYIKKNLPEVPQEFIKYMEYIASLKNNSVPDYNYCRKLLCDKLSELKCSSPYDKLSFNTSSDKILSPSINKKSASKAKLNSKKVTSPVISENSSEVSSMVRNARKRKSPVLNDNHQTNNKIRNGRKRKSPVLNDNDHEIGTKEDIGKEVKIKKSRKKVVISDVDPVPSSSTDGNREEHVNNSDSDSFDNGIEDEHNIKRKKLVRRSSVKLNVKKRLSVVSRTKRLKANENSRIVVNVSATGSDTDSIKLENNVKKNRVVPSRRKNKANDENKPSWRDAPTVKASKVKIAGEYTKTDSKKSSSRNK